MSGAAYRLETPRSRPPPPPLRFQNASPRPSSVVNGALLYDLPSVSMSPPPTSPKALSPTSSTFAGRSRAPRSRPTPPPSSRNRSITPLGVARSDLEKFAEYCREWYYNQDDNSGRLMTQTLANLPPSQRAPFARLQASIRSAYHANVNARRTAELQAHLSATQPGGSLMPHSRADPGGPEAKKERYDRLERFIRTWCTMGLPGTKPFFEALWAVMRLQVIPQHLGGAGGNRIEWEFDDAVFKEAAGKDFMLEAIDVLKGVLAFEEVLSSKRSPTQQYSLRATSPTTSSQLHARSQSQPLPNQSHPPRTTLATTIQAKRARAPSDPFLDTPALSYSLSSQSSGTTTAPLFALASDATDEPPSPTTTPPVDADEFPAFSQGEFPLDDDEEEYMRTWTSPDLPDPELLNLLKAFPTLITRQALPRFPVIRQHLADVEEGRDERSEGKEIRFGTGSIWISQRERAPGYEGGWWTQFVSWWKRLFC